jgi:hypothetical protein
MQSHEGPLEEAVKAVLRNRSSVRFGGLVIHPTAKGCELTLVSEASELQLASAQVHFKLLVRAFRKQTVRIEFRKPVNCSFDGWESFFVWLDELKEQPIKKQAADGVRRTLTPCGRRTHASVSSPPGAT